MSSRVPEERIEAVRKAVPADVLEALVDREMAIRREKRQADRAEKREQEQPPKRGTASYREVLSGGYRRRRAPQASPNDRRYVPGALRHWRKVHGLNFREAQERIGYSPRSSTWRHWEDGFVAPPYEALLRIIAATGLGHWVDRAHASIDPALRLDVLRAQSKEETRRRRMKRTARTRSDRPGASG